MDIRIGLADSPRELGIELADDANAETIKSQVEAGVGDSSMIWITDAKGRQIGFRGDKVTFVDLGSEDGPRMGFG